MKTRIILWIVIVGLVLSACGNNFPERCSLCDDLSRHAPCIINLSTGEKLELEIYDPHPSLVGEIAEEQRGGYFSFVRGAGVEGYKLGAESVTITIPVKFDKMDQRYFCNDCREQLADLKQSGYALVDLKNVDQPTIYSIEDGNSFSIRCYEVTIKELTELNEYEISVIGTYTPDNNNNK